MTWARSKRPSKKLEPAMIEHAMREARKLGWCAMATTLYEEHGDGSTVELGLGVKAWRRTGRTPWPVVFATNGADLMRLIQQHNERELVNG